jgi:hypothetical protein
MIARGIHEALNGGLLRAQMHHVGNRGRAMALDHLPARAFENEDIGLALQGRLGLSCEMHPVHERGPSGLAVLEGFRLDFLQREQIRDFREELSHTLADDGPAPVLVLGRTDEAQFISTREKPGENPGLSRRNRRVPAPGDRE